MGKTTEKSIISVRYTIAIMIFFCLFVAFAMRINLSVGIVAMTTNSSNSHFPILNWDTKIKSFVLSSYFCGYVILQLPAGLFCQRYGAKTLLFVAIFGCGLVSILTPVVAIYCSWKIVAALRVIQGFGQGCIYPCIYSLISKWSPPLERNKFLSFLFSGLQAGTVTTLFGTGYLAAGPGGWPSVFYVSGSMGILWALLWIYVGANSPAEHKFISEKEKNKIESLLIHTSFDNNKMKIPWFEIFTSVPMWALIICHFCENWGFYTVLLLMPSYLSSALNIDIKNNGLISAIPYLLMWMFTIVFSRLADYILKKKIIRPNIAKKMWNSIGMWGSAVGYIGLTMMSSTTLAIILLTLTISINSGVQMGFFTNHLELSPNFSSILIGITNCLANTASFLAPFTAGFILKDETNIEQWNTLFYLCASIFFVGNLIFLVFGTTEVQPWNKPKILCEDELGVPLTTVQSVNIVKSNLQDNR